ncbi:MAG TPA: hypothetical protein PLI53_08270 [Geobacteraceae bacterium]|jgi:hypothetical protein|nr:hypothetical protein [Geobacteraceae bacterium]
MGDFLAALLGAPKALAEEDIPTIVLRQVAIAVLTTHPGVVLLIGPYDGEKTP